MSKHLGGNIVDAKKFQRAVGSGENFLAIWISVDLSSGFCHHDMTR